MRACNNNACEESKGQNSHESLLDLPFSIFADGPKAPIYCHLISRQRLNRVLVSDGTRNRCKPAITFAELLGSCVEGAIPLAVVGLNRRTNSFVMCGSSALGHGGTSATAMRCWHFAAPSITVPSIGYLNAIDSDFERRKNHRMLLTTFGSFVNNLGASDTSFLICFITPPSGISLKFL
jgi:hypothetical protein